MVHSTNWILSVYNVFTCSARYTHYCRMTTIFLSSHLFNWRVYARFLLFAWYIKDDIFSCLVSFLPHSSPRKFVFFLVLYICKLLLQVLSPRSEVFWRAHQRVIVISSYSPYPGVHIFETQLMHCHCYKLICLSIPLPHPLVSGPSLTH